MNNTTNEVTDRHLEIAERLPRVEQYLAYCEARLAGKSHIYAMAKACAA